MIGGNKTGIIQTRSTVENEYGEDDVVYTDAQSITGWLDLMSGDSRYTSYDAKIEEATNIFVADYVALADGITAEKSRMIIDGKLYDIKYIDNPMELNLQLEIYLKCTGGQ